MLQNSIEDLFSYLRFLRFSPFNSYPFFHRSIVMNKDPSSILSKITESILLRFVDFSDFVCAKETMFSAVMLNNFMIVGVQRRIFPTPIIS